MTECLLDGDGGSQGLSSISVSGVFPLPSGRIGRTVGLINKNYREKLNILVNIPFAAASRFAREAALGTTRLFRCSALAGLLDKC